MPQEKPFPIVILVVEDEPSIVHLIKLNLETEGYAVIGEATGNAALERIKKTSVSVVLCDLGLPDMSGLEILKKIKSVRPGLPVIIVTGRHDEEEGRRAFDLGAWGYVTKPIDFDYLRNILLLQFPGHSQ